MSKDDIEALPDDLFEMARGMTMEEVIRRFGPDKAKKLIDLMSRRIPTASFGRPTHLKAVLRWALGRDSFTAEEVRDFLKSIDPNVKDEKLSYTKTGLLRWNYTTFFEENGVFRLTPPAEEVARALSDGEGVTTLDLVILRGMYLPQGTRYGGPMARVYSLFTADPDRVWTRPELEEEYKRCFTPILRPRDPDKRSRWEVSQFLTYMEELELISRVGRGRYKLVVI